MHTVDRCGRTDEESIMALDKGKYTKGPIYAEMWMNDKSVKFQIDSGATVNVLPNKYVSKDDIHPCDVTLHMWNRTTREVIGKTLATLVNPVNQTSYSVQFEVVEGNLTPLLGRHAAEKMELITVNYDCFKLLHQVMTTIMTVSSYFIKS